MAPKLLVEKPQHSLQRPVGPVPRLARDDVQIDQGSIHLTLLSFFLSLSFQTESSLSNLQRSIHPLTLQKLKGILYVKQEEGEGEEVAYDESEASEEANLPPPPPPSGQPQQQQQRPLKKRVPKQRVEL